MLHASLLFVGMAAALFMLKGAWLPSSWQEKNESLSSLEKEKENFCFAKKGKLFLFEEESKSFLSVSEEQNLASLKEKRKSFDF